MGSRKTIRSKAEGSNIRNRGMDSNRAIPNRDMTNKVTLSRDMVNNRDTLNKVILNKDTANSKDTRSKVMHNKDTGSNRAMDNHCRIILPGMLRPKKRRP